ncbi:MAG TPA: dihydrolipoamide acetyltransferase family protein [Stellaceae bacterium]|nr:dihydrolipoamide acetyltransferase family protein [Stellaceae bacterium]
MNVIMPQLGETVAEGKLASWFKSVGDKVAAGENLFLIETDKVSMEVQATESGVLNEIRVAAGETVPVGTVVAVLGEAGSKPVAAAPAPVKAPPAKAEAPVPVQAPREAALVPRAKPASSKAAPFVMKPFDEVRTPISFALPAVSLDGLKVTPLARRLIKESGADLASIVQSVRLRGGWRIAASDVQGAPAVRAERAAARVPVVLREGDSIEKLNTIRALTASHLAEAWRTIPHAFQAVEVDFSAISEARQKAKESFAQRHGFALTYLPFIARAVCLALNDFPRLNASFDHDRLILHGDVHLGIAADLGHDGLMVPVVLHADEMNAGGLAKAISRQVEKARLGKLTPGDISGGTYTITNNGSFGTLFTMPVINAPQVAILSFDAVRKKPVVIEGKAGDKIEARPIAVLGQSFDHRAVDGAYSASFLQKLKRVAETHDWDAELS